MLNEIGLGGMPTRPIFITAILDIQSRFRDEMAAVNRICHTTCMMGMALIC